MEEVTFPRPLATEEAQVELNTKPVSHQMLCGNKKHFHAQLHILSTHPPNHCKITIAHTFNNNNNLLKQNTALVVLSPVHSEKGLLSSALGSP